MKNLLTGAVAAAALALFGHAALAADSMSGSSMMMPACATGDPVVGVNMSTKMYMTSDQMKAKSAGMTSSQKQAMMEKNHVKMMCKSKASAMGAKPMPSSMKSSM